MIKDKHIFFISLIFFSILSCDTLEEKRQKSFESNILKVSNNITEWDSLISDAFKYGNKYGQNDSLIRSTQTKQLANPLRSKLNDKGVQNIWIRKLDNNCIDAEFTTDWDSSLGTTHLTWTSCHPEDSGTAFYNHWDDRILVQQIDENWWMWITY